MYDPFFNPTREFLKALWKVIAIFTIAAIIIALCTSCRTSRIERTNIMQHDTTITVYHYDTLYVQVTDTTRTHITIEERTHATHDIIYDAATGNKQSEHWTFDAQSFIDSLRQSMLQYNISLQTADSLHLDTHNSIATQDIQQNAGEAIDTTANAWLQAGKFFLGVIILMILFIIIPLWIKRVFHI